MLIKKILLIDNNDIDNFINSTLIRSSGWGVETDALESAMEGLEYLQKVSTQPNAIPELILLDLGMQIMDGFGFLDEFVKLPPAITEYTKVVVLTSSVDPIDRRRSRAYPYVIDLMEKPLNVVKLRALLGN